MNTNAVLIVMNLPSVASVKALATTSPSPSPQSTRSPARADSSHPHQMSGSVSSSVSNSEHAQSHITLLPVSIRGDADQRRHQNIPELLLSSTEDPDTQLTDDHTYHADQNTASPHPQRNSFEMGSTSNNNSTQSVSGSIGLSNLSSMSNLQASTSSTATKWSQRLFRQKRNVRFEEKDEQHLLTEHSIYPVDIVREILAGFEDIDPVFLPNADHSQYQVTFSSVYNTEAILRKFYSIGLGSDFGSLWVVPVDVARPCPKLRSDSTAPTTLRSYAVLEKVIENVRSNSVIKLDFTILLIVAAIIAAMGLATDSSVNILAAMLISPLMGPVMGLSFATMVQDLQLIKKSFIALSFGITTALIVGFVSGCALTPFGAFLTWPTAEMSSRGTISNLYVGIVVATASGIGVAVSLLNSNASSLVGVAISASLLPPVVNTGMLLAYAAISPSIAGANAMNADLQYMAGISFSLTIVNIACIYVSAIATLKLKQVAPVPGKTVEWKKFVDLADMQTNTKRRMTVQELFTKTFDEELENTPSTSSMSDAPRKKSRWSGSTGRSSTPS